MVRVSASFGIMLMLFYWMAHMDFPFIENKNNFIVDYHIVYATILGYLIYKQAGHFGVSMGSLQEFPPSGMAKPCTLSSLNRRSSGRLHA
jgi:hypothetical protein